MAILGGLKIFWKPFFLFQCSLVIHYAPTIVWIVRIYCLYKHAVENLKYMTLQIFCRNEPQLKISHIKQVIKYLIKPARNRDDNWIIWTKICQTYVFYLIFGFQISSNLLRWLNLDFSGCLSLVNNKVQHKKLKVSKDYVCHLCPMQQIFSTWDPPVTNERAFNRLQPI